MPPKVKTTKEEIVSTAVDIVRKNGAQALNARSVASVLNCSTQPVFSNFETMEELRLAVMERADSLFREYMQREISSGEFPIYKASGLAYIRFAREEKELFKLLYMHDRLGTPIPERTELLTQMEGLVQNYTGLNATKARLFHLEMWVFVHGIATMFATGYLDLEWELVCRMLTDAYQGLRKQYGME